MSAVTPSSEQSAAIAKIIEWYRSGGQEFYLAGFAGVGKSTVANVAIEELKEKCGVKRVRTAAYTGKAASVLRKKGVAGAQTIHSLIYSPVEDEETGEVSFVLSEDSPAADADLIVLDECSMVSQEIARDIRSYKRKVLVLGDPAQLPPISGEGAFTSGEPDVFLREIHRQAAESPVIFLATLAREGKPWPKGFDRDGVRVLPLTKETQPLIYREETQAICGLNRVRHCYTQRIRRLRGYAGEMPVRGERLICRRNDREEGLFNGGIGTLLGIRMHEKIGGAVEIDVQMEDLESPTENLAVDPYLFKQHFTNGEAKKMVLPKGSPRLQSYDWSAILTCHASQGSQFPDVTVVDDSSAFREHRNNWRYTACTRSEGGLTILVRD